MFIKHLRLLSLISPTAFMIALSLCFLLHLPADGQGLGGAHGSCVEIEEADFQVPELFRSDCEGAAVVPLAPLGRPVEALTR